MFKYETQGYKFLAWTSVAAMVLRALCLLGALSALVMFFLFPDIPDSVVSRIAIFSVTADILALAYLFFANLQTKFFRKRTVWSFVGAAALLLLALFICVVLVTFEDGSFGAVTLELITYVLIGAYMLVPGYCSCKDVYELFTRLSAEAKERKKSVAERLRNAKKY